MATVDFPAMPLEEWAATKETLHRFLQVVGKVRLAASARRNHWWHVPFHLTGRGITTRPMGQIDGNPIFCVDFDFVAHELRIAVLDGRGVSLPLLGQSVATLHAGLHGALRDLGVSVRVEHDTPFDLPDTDRPFAEDYEHATYDPVMANRYWRILSQVNLLLEQFSANYSGKISPVHQFWHTFDIAVTRFGGQRVDQPYSAGSVIREAYSRDVISFGFWFGDDSVPEPAFYAYAAPEPDELGRQPLRPREASWVPQAGHHLAVLRYNDVRGALDPGAVVLDFYESAYQAGAALLGWDIAALACPAGVTDPRLEVEP